MTEEDKKALDEYKNELLNLLDKSQDAFEKQLSYISASAIGVSMLLIEKIFPDLSETDYKYLLTLGWILLSATLLVNLCSHLIAAMFHRRTIADLNSEGYKDYNYRKVDSRNRITNTINWVCAVMLFLGVLFFVIFVSINI